MPGECIIDMLRHGDTGVNGFYGSLDIPLSALGWQQMKNTTKNKANWQVIISSPLRRCAEFAKVFSKKSNLLLVLDNRLRELDFGEWEGKSAEQLMIENADDLIQFWTDPWTYTPPCGEQLIEFEKRVKMAWSEICDSYSGKRLLFITHGGVIRMLLHLAGQVSRTQLLKIDVLHASLHTLERTGANHVCL